jgi:hypothetical protein
MQRCQLSRSLQSGLDSEPGLFKPDFAVEGHVEVDRRNLKRHLRGERFVSREFPVLKRILDRPLDFPLRAHTDCLQELANAEVEYFRVHEYAYSSLSLGAPRRAGSFLNRSQILGRIEDEVKRNLIFAKPIFFHINPKSARSDNAKGAIDTNKKELKVEYLSFYSIVACAQDPRNQRRLL